MKFYCDYNLSNDFHINGHFLDMCIRMEKFNINLEAVR